MTSYITKKALDMVTPASNSTHLPPSDVNIDKAKPMWGQVGKLGDQYWEWVHIAEPGTSRFFESDFLEMFSKTPWWLVPLIYIPAIALVLWDAFTTGKSTYTDIFAGFMIGSILWQIHEYTFHR